MPDDDEHYVYAIALENSPEEPLRCLQRCEAGAAFQPDLLDVWKIAARAAADRSDRAAKDSPKASPGARRSSTQYDSGSQGTLSSLQGAVANAPTRGAGMQTRPSKFWAGRKVLALASSARCC